MENPNNEQQAVNTGLGGITTGFTNMFDKVKGPVFWVALGYVVCKVMDRKKVKAIG